MILLGEGNAYLWWKVVHIISFTAWMAGLFYLPRLFVYHAMSPINSKRSGLLRTMERKLLYGIMFPSLAATVVTGFVLSFPWLGSGWWLLAKVILVGILIMCHWLNMRWMRSFACDCNHHSHVFYRIVNEIPTIILSAIVILVIFKPF